MHVATAESTSREGDREYARPVIATGVLVDFRGAAELRAEHDDGAVEHPATVEVADEGSVGLVEVRELALHAFRDAGVHIPSAEGDGHHADTSFHEATRHEETLTSGIGAVLVFDGLRFCVEVERFASGLRANERVGGLVEAVHCREGVGLLEGAEMVVDCFEDAATAVEACLVNARVHVEIAHFEAFGGRVTAETEWAEGV